MLSDLSGEKVLHFRRTTVILFLTGVLLTAPLLALYFSGFRTPQDITHALPGLRAPTSKTLVIYPLLRESTPSRQFSVLLRAWHARGSGFFVRPQWRHQ